MHLYLWDDKNILVFPFQDILNADKAGILKEPPYFGTIIYSFLCLTNTFIWPLWYTKVNKTRKYSCEEPWETSAVAWPEVHFQEIPPAGLQRRDFGGARREAKREKNHACLELTQNLVSWSKVQISKLELGTQHRQIRSRARLLLLKSWRIQASRLNASLNLEQREGLCVGIVQRKAGQVATLLGWRRQVQPCSLVMDGFTLFPHGSPRWGWRVARPLGSSEKSLGFSCTLSSP